MTAREFFYLVASVRTAQTDYFATRDQYLLRRCKALERELDAEIARVKALEQARAVPTATVRDSSIGY